MFLIAVISGYAQSDTKPPKITNTKGRVLVPTNKKYNSVKTDYEHSSFKGDVKGSPNYDRPGKGTNIKGKNLAPKNDYQSVKTNQEHSGFKGDVKGNPNYDVRTTGTNFKGRYKINKNQEYINAKKNITNDIKKLDQGSRNLNEKKKENLANMKKSEQGTISNKHVNKQNNISWQNNANHSNYKGNNKFSITEKDANYLRTANIMRNFTGNIKSNMNNEKAPVVGNYKGDIKQNPGDKYGRYARTSNIISNYSGSIRYKPLDQKSPPIGNYKGDIKISGNYLNDKGNTEMTNYKGNQRDVMKGKRADLKDEMEKYSSGDISLSFIEKRNKAIRKEAKDMANFHGSPNKDYERLVENRENLKKEMGTYGSGDVPLRDLEKREKSIRQKGREMAEYQGSIKNSDLKKWQASIRKREKDIANYTGTIKIERRKKDAHPSSVYRGGIVANSYSQKEKMRKKMIKKYGKKGDADKPRHLNDPEMQKKPKYNAKESEIWW